MATAMGMICFVFRDSLRTGGFGQDKITADASWLGGLQDLLKK